MEPIGLAVGVAGLAGLFSSCLEAVERFDSYKNFDRDSRSLTTQLDAAKHLLEQWGRAVGIENGKLSDNHHPALDNEKTLEVVRKLLSSIQDFCGGPDEATLQTTTLTDGDFLKSGLLPSQRIKQSHHGASANLKWKMTSWALAGKSKRTNNVQTVAVLVQHLYSLVPINDTKECEDASPSEHIWLAKIQALVDKAEEEMRAETKRDLRAWLGSPSLNDLCDDSIKKRLEGTCEWILERDSVLGWLSPDTSPDGASVLWINGPAGFGKTVLCAKLVEILSSRLQTPVAHFFLSSKFEGRDDPYAAVRSWIATVCFRSPAALDVVYKKRLAQHEQVATRATIMKLFREVLQAVPFCTFVLDGLDESTWLGENRNDGNSVARFLEELRQAITDTTVRILVTSRNEPEIRLELSQFPGFSDYAISPEDVRDDNVAYSRSIVNSKLPNKDEPTRLSISQRMADRSNGQFQWIKMQEGFLRKGRNKKQLEKDIDETPAGLDRLYDRTWERIEGLRDAERNRAFSLLRWAAFALRPLTVCEITEAVLIDDDYDDLPLDELPDSVDDDYIESEILGLCGSLIEVRGILPDSSPGSRKIHLTHFSVKQYLLYKIPSWGAVLLADERLRASNETLEGITLAKLCLRYISFQRVWDESSVEDDNQLGASFRNYAAEHWYQHTDLSKADDHPLMEAINALFDGRVGTWESWRKWFDLNGEDSHPEATETAASPLYYASRLGLTGVVKHLIQYCKHNPNDSSESGRAALVVACERGSLEVARILLEAGNKVNVTGYRGRTPLYSASMNGHLEVLKLILEKGGDLTVANAAGWAPLHIAADNGHLEVVSLLLAKGAEVAVADEDGWTPLISAATNGHIEVVRLLLERGADISATNNYGWTPLRLAADNGHLEVVSLLLAKGAEVAVADEDGWTPLISAATNGHVEVVRLLLERGADISVTSNDGWMPLSSAADEGHVEVVRLLLEKGADIEVLSKDGRTVLDLAADGGHVEVVRLLLEKGADIEVLNKDGWTALISAACSGHLEVVRLLLDKGADTSIANPGGWTPLNSAASNGHLEVARLLLDEGADIAVFGNYRWPPVISATKNGHLKVVRLLLDRGADLAVANKDGWTPLMIASSLGHAEIVRLLLKKGADITDASNYGVTSLDSAAYNGHDQIVKLLLDNGADCAVVNNDGWTPLHSASRLNNCRTVQMLLEKGASPAAESHKGWMPLHLASDNGHAEVAKLLLEKGASPASKTHVGWTSLHLASDNGHAEVAKLLLEKGASPASKTHVGWTSLHSASANGHVEVAKLLLEKGASPAAKSHVGWTSLHSASANGHVEVVRLLLEKGASPAARDHYGWTSLYAASANGCVEVARLLVENGATASVGDERSRTHVEMGKLLISKGAEIFVAENKGWTPLHIASLKGFSELVRLFLERFPDHTDARDDTSRTPLYYAAMQGHSEVVKLLLSRLASANAMDCYNATPLIAAARDGHAGVVELLLDEDGVWFNHKDKLGRSALCWARQSGHVHTIQLLVKHSQGTTETQPGNENAPTGDRAALFKPDSCWCDVCTICLPEGKSYHWCKDCYGGMFDVCLDCFQAGFRCLDDSHKLVLESSD